MKIYDFKTIKETVSISRYLQDQGVRVVDNRFPAVWRNSSDRNCSVSPDGRSFFDHVEKQSGSVIDLAMLIEKVSVATLAASVLGERYSAEAKSETRFVAPPNSRYESLVAEGWQHQATYKYTDENGAELYSVLRLYNPKTKDKTFLQKSPDHWGLENVRRVLYRLPEVMKSDKVFIVEGEKDADTLAANGFCATTNSGGAKNWNADFTRFLQGKHVVILADNDEAGQEHARLVVREINDIVASLKVLTPSKLPKGDVTDFFVSEKGTVAELQKMIEDAPFYDRRAISAANAQYSVEQARALNVEPFRNFVEQEIEENGKKKTIEVPIKVRDLCEECKRRFLNFPRRMAGVLFDCSPHTGKIAYISSTDALFAWIAISSKQPVEWSKARGAVTQSQFFQALLLSVDAYDSISAAPHYPLRKEVFYTNKPLPQILPGEPSALENLVSRFSPAASVYVPLLKAFFMSPMFYGDNAPRPAWVIDSVDGKGVGKTTLVKLLASLYNEQPLDVDTASVKNDIAAITKRLISSEGRSKRIVLLDNVQGSYKSPNLARLITATSVSGIAPYGRGEETRVNDLTYIITSNAASLDDDLAQRTYTIKLKRSRRAVHWESDVRRFIDENRERIYAEILDRLTHPRVAIEASKTRYPEYERCVLCAACESQAEYDAVIGIIQSDNDASNVTTDRAQEVQEVFRDAIVELLVGIPGATARPSFLNAAAMSHIIANSETLRLEGIKKGEIDEMIQSGTLTECFSKQVRTIRSCGRTIRGRLWIGGLEVKPEEKYFTNLIAVEKDRLTYRNCEMRSFLEI